MALWHQSKVSLPNLRYGMDLLADVTLHRQVANPTAFWIRPHPGLPGQPYIPIPTRYRR